MKEGKGVTMEHEGVDSVLPENWPWENNYWKASDGRLVGGSIVHLWTHKLWNKLQKAKNGNRNMQLKVIHWNLGARRWENKLMMCSSYWMN